METIKTVESIKREAKAIARATTISHSQALDVLAVQAGYTHWGAYQNSIDEHARLAAERIARTIRPYDLVKAMIPDMRYVSPDLERARHLIVSGGTSCGKTTALNKLLTFLPTSVPVAVLEEYPEIINPNPIKHLALNTDMLRELGHPAYETMRHAAARNGAGVLVYGEVSTRNASDIMNAFREPEGPSVLTTIHAESPRDALNAFKAKFGAETAPHGMESVICVQMRRDPTGRRHVSEVVTLSPVYA